MVSIAVHYDGALRCTSTHAPSRSTLQTDAPVDNNGKGETFSPTDLVATGLATCILTTMGILAQRLNIDMTDASAHVEKIMTNGPPRRIARLPVTITMPAGISDIDKQKLENAARTCPVHHSLHPDVDAPIEFIWKD